MLRPQVESATHPLHKGLLAHKGMEREIAAIGIESDHDLLVDSAVGEDETMVGFLYGGINAFGVAVEFSYVGESDRASP